MKKLKCPVVDDIQNYDECAARTATVAKQTLKVNNRGNVANLFTEYLQKAGIKEFYNIAPLFDGHQTDERKTLEQNYEFMNDGRYLRALYATIKSLPKFGDCPFCEALPVSSVDHYLPKSIYGEYSVFAPNLVAACDNCNEVSKRQHVPSGYEDQFFHPYFDDTPADIFLIATTNIGQAVSLEYSILPTRTWSAKEAKRASFNFVRLNLGSIYTTKAAQRLSNMKGRLVGLLDEHGPNAVQKHLQEELVSLEQGDSGLNGWETVMYRSLATSDPFFQGGLRLISV